jgi:hypothetical protein
MFIIDLFPSLTHLYFHPNYSRITLFLATLLLGAGILLASFGYKKIKNNYGLLSGTAGFAFGIIASVLVFSTAIVDLITPEYVILIYPPPLIFQINSLVHLLNGVFFGLTLIVWGITHFKSHKFSIKPKFSLLTSGFFIASGFVILSIFYVNIGFVFSIVSLLFASIVFLTFRSNI